MGDPSTAARAATGSDPVLGRFVGPDRELAGTRGEVRLALLVDGDEVQPVARRRVQHGLDRRYIRGVDRAWRQASVLGRVVWRVHVQVALGQVVDVLVDRVSDRAVQPEVPRRALVQPVVDHPRDLPVVLRWYLTFEQARLDDHLVLSELGGFRLGRQVQARDLGVELLHHGLQHLQGRRAGLEVISGGPQEALRIAVRPGRQAQCRGVIQRRLELAQRKPGLGGQQGDDLARAHAVRDGHGHLDPRLRTDEQLPGQRGAHVLVQPERAWLEQTRLAAGLGYCAEGRGGGDDPFADQGIFQRAARDRARRNRDENRAVALSAGPVGMPAGVPVVGIGAAPDEPAQEQDEHRERDQARAAALATRRAMAELVLRRAKTPEKAVVPRTVGVELVLGLSVAVAAARYAGVVHRPRPVIASVLVRPACGGAVSLIVIPPAVRCCSWLVIPGRTVIPGLTGAALATGVA